MRTHMRPIKVAVIDDGVSVGELSSGKSYCGGWYADKATPDHRSMNTFYFSEKGHGTEMAKLIQRVCPFATFFIGKLDTRNTIYKSVAESAVAVSESKPCFHAL